MKFKYFCELNFIVNLTKLIEIIPILEDWWLFPTLLQYQTVKHIFGGFIYVTP